MSLSVLAVRPLNMVGTVFLARLLDPKDFGLVALAMLVFNTIHPLVALGMMPALIQSKLKREDIAFPAFLVTLLTSTSLFLVVVLNSGLLARLLGSAEVEEVLRALSIVIVLTALPIVPRALLQKDLRFGPIGMSGFFPRLIELGVSLTLAFFGHGVWSLVYGRLTNAVVTVAILWIAERSRVWLRPRRWRSEDLRSLLRYGLRATGSSIANVLNNSWDSWLVGRALGPTSLGYYSKAFKLTNQTMEGISRQVVDSVFLPTYAEIQDERERLARVYVKSTSVVSLIVVPLALGMFILAPEAVPVLFGAKWLPMVPALQILALKTLFRPLSMSASSLFQGTGRPEYDLRAGAVYALVLVPLSLFMLRWDFPGVAAAVVVAHAVSWAYNMWQVTRVLPRILRRIVSALLPGLAAGGAMILVVQLLKEPLRSLVGGTQNLLSVGIMVGLGVAIYAVAVFLLQRSLFLEILHLFLGVLKGERRTKRRAAPKEVD